MENAEEVNCQQKKIPAKRRIFTTLKEHHENNDEEEPAAQLQEDKRWGDVVFKN